MSTPSSLPPQYQGTDWFTDHETMAEAFDALDQMHDLCFSHIGEGVEDEPPEVFLACFSDLCDGLTSALLFIEAALCPRAPRQAFAMRWRLAEMRLIVKNLQNALLEPIESAPLFFENSLLDIGRIKDGLKTLEA